MIVRGKTYWLVGASDGIGEALARHLVSEGAQVILSGRSEDRLGGIADELGPLARALPMDVTDAEAVRNAAVQAAHMDGFVYLAGAYWPMTAQEWDPGKVSTMTDVNYLGALRVLGEVLPRMVKSGQGHIVLVGSLAGFSGLPGAIGYGASKAALMHLGLDMQQDLRGSGVKVQIINPGFVRTRLTDKNSFRMPFIMDPDKAGELMCKAMKTSRRVVSFPALFALWFKGRRTLGL